MIDKFFDTKFKRILCVVFIIISIIFFSFSYYKIFNNYKVSIPCLFHKFTGLYCPGCGITRAIFSLLEFNIVAAIKYNLLLFTVVPILLFYFYIKLYYWVIMKKNNKKIISDKLWNFMLIFTIVFGIIRNFDFFSFLAP